MKHTLIKQSIQTLLIALLLLPFATIKTQAAAGPSSAIDLTATTTGALADGTSKITVSVSSFWYNCNGGGYSSSKEECDYLDPPGWDGTTTVKTGEKTYISADEGATVSVSEITTDGSGKASFTVTSSKVGSYYVYSKTYSGFVKDKIKLTFKDPTPETEPVKSTTPTTTQKTTHPTESTPEATKPDTPKIDLVDDKGRALAAKDGEDKIAFKQGDPINLSGKTVPGGVVKLYIFSEPQEAEVTADENGNWSYSIASIEPGEHRVEAEVTDPATGETSDRAEVLSFTVAQAETPEETVVANETTTLQKEEESSNAVLYGAITGVVIVLAVAVAGFIFWKKKKNGNDTSISSNQNDMPQQESNEITTENRSESESNTN